MRRTNYSIWPVMLLATITMVLMLIIKPAILTEAELRLDSPINKNSGTTNAGNSIWSSGNKINFDAFGAKNHQTATRKSTRKKLRVLLLQLPNITADNKGKRHDQQFIKSSSGLCPGAYEHAL